MKGRTFADRLEVHGEALAVVTDGGATLSYQALATRADAFAAGLGDARRLLVIEVANELEPLVAYLGALRAGHPVLLTAAGGAHERLYDTFRPGARYARDAVGGWTLHLADEAGPTTHPDLAVLLSTSGTTGATKLVRLAASAVEANAASIAEYLGIAADDRAITSLPFHYSYGLSVVNSHLSRGAALLLTDRSVVDHEFWSFFTRHGATTLAGVPYTYELLERVGFRDRDLPTLRTLTQAGGRLPAETVTTYARWAAARHVRFFVMYGQTEATARMAYLPPEQAAEHPDSIGIAIPGGRFRLIDLDGRPIDTPETEGELVYEGPNVMMGYATAAEDLARGPELTELRTGDLARRSAEGLYRITGRMSRFAKLYGLRVSLDEIEARLSLIGAKGVVVSDDQTIHVALAGGAAPGDVLRDLAAQYKLPEAVFSVHSWDELPTLPSGKFDYQAILAASQDLARQDNLAHSAKQDSIEVAFARCFPRAIVRPNSSFVALGGDSLNYVTLSLEVERVLGYLPEAWEQLTVAELDGLRPVARANRPWSLRGMETDTILRALATLAVVTTHASHLVVGGGAEVLLILAGFNLSRYQKSRIQAGRSFEFTWSFTKRIIAPYYVLLVAYLILKRQLDVPSLLLVSNYFGRYGSLIEPFWFLETLLQSFVIISLITLIPAVRRLIQRDAWRFGLMVLGVALAVRMASFYLFDQLGDLGNRTPDSVLYLVAMGWCIHEATTRGRAILISATMVVLSTFGLGLLPDLWFVYPYPSNYSHVVWKLACVFSLLWIPRIYVPKILHTTFGAIAGAGFYIYLTHVIPVWILYWKLGVESLAINLTVSVLVGIAAWRASEWLSQTLARRQSKIA